ncbi:MAG: hypothetical protein KDD11_16595 [Acidobacteria bacterium]|nr:hypothetical protein [Acidobacteriota bacterium]
MAKTAATEDTAPTMIIPKGTEIQVDKHGQLSVRTPGNLVIQNSGHYAHLESAGGSIRIEPHVQVEAVSVKCADTCYVQGNLTAWRVSARTLHLEDTAQAHIVLQDTESLEVGRGARLIGNFSSEKELFFLFSRFSQQVRSLPFYQERDEDKSQPEAVPVEPEGARDSLSLLSAADPSATAELDDPLFFALVLLERDRNKNVHPGDEERVLDELIKLLRQGDLETLRHTHRALFNRITGAGQLVDRARQLIARHFAALTAEPEYSEVEREPAADGGEG